MPGMVLHRGHEFVFFLPVAKTSSVGSNCAVTRGNTSAAHTAPL
jgi:hypothetical protein